MQNNVPTLKSAAQPLHFFSLYRHGQSNSPAMLNWGNFLSEWPDAQTLLPQKVAQEKSGLTCNLTTNAALDEINPSADLKTQFWHRAIKKKSLLCFINVPHPDLKCSFVSPVHSLSNPSKGPASNQTSGVSASETEETILFPENAQQQNTSWVVHCRYFQNYEE